MQRKTGRIRRNFVAQKVCDFLDDFDIYSLPIQPRYIINCAGWTLRTYRFYAEKHKVKHIDIIKSFKSEDGVTIYNSGKYSIAYNDLKPFVRQRFTLMHEIGHIYLDHLIDYDQTILNRGGLTEGQFDMLEAEANLFASLALAPPEVLISLNWTSVDKIRAYCCLSETAATWRFEEINKKVYNLISSGIRNQMRNHFHNFINQKTCKRCDHTFVSKDAKFCPVCGKEKIVWGRKGTMVYDEIELDEQGKAVVCPRCNNENIISEGEYCHICGAYLVNKCTGHYVSNDYGESYFQDGCGAIAPGNARYCPYCGDETTFYKNGLLQDWNRLTQKSQDDVDEIPF